MAGVAGFWHDAACSSSVGRLLPHDGQNLAPAGIVFPQYGQCMIFFFPFTFYFLTSSAVMMLPHTTKTGCTADGIHKWRPRGSDCPESARIVPRASHTYLSREHSTFGNR